MTQYLERTLSIDAEKFSAGHISVLHIFPRPEDDEYTVIILHKDHPGVVTDETTVKWQALSLAYLMAAAASDEGEQQDTRESFAGYMPELEFSYIEQLAPTNAAGIYQDILHGRDGYPELHETELLEKIGLRFMCKWLTRKHGGELTDEQADVLATKLIEEEPKPAAAP